jgi:hypothetical protein
MLSLYEQDATTGGIPTFGKIRVLCGRKSNPWVKLRNRLGIGTTKANAKVGELTSANNAAGLSNINTFTTNGRRAPPRTGFFSIWVFDFLLPLLILVC